MDINSMMLTVFLVLNIILAIFVIFLERRDAGATWAWLMVLFFIPLLGFFMYLFFGQNLTRRKMFQWEDRKKIGIDELLSNQIRGIREKDFHFRNEIIENSKDLIYMHLINNDAVLTQDNGVTIFTDGKEKFNSLIEDIKQATDHIHLQYYIFKRDNLGRSLINLLTEKAREGVKVRLLYDELGSRSLHKKAFKELIAAGGEIEAFFPSRLHFINLRINYRNHRKIAIIDGKIGYVGGFNVGDEYLGLNPKFGYWRDTHLRIKGSAVHSLQTRFILDWNHASHRHDIYYAPKYFPLAESLDSVGMQIVTSGPDSEWEQIKNGYIKMISSARKSIYIQTPYFIPDASLLDALKIAALSGVEVNIMIPNKPDHMFVYWATYSYIGEMLKANANIYIYDNGFIHAKTLIVDEKVSSVGTANIDVRSFRLNFEVNAFIYDEEVSKELTESFKNDVKLSAVLTAEDYRNRALKIKLKESISRLLSPIL
ncbi:phospholipase D [Sporosarcina globispora]|uniref:Cardiolipin synthase n=1 Tax=Sporosarcina globispora TaxID=1459 RepID=A0A0M0GL54_SPOGL|nr:cardiolipin synthase [Sporosarcina globispora]KON90227.1 phospholipase D [Sporosarcina globispora]